MKKICIITGSRAEYGLLKSLIKLFKNSNCHILQLVATGSHLSEKHGYTINEIIKDDFHIDYEIDILDGLDNKISISKSIGIGIVKFTDCLSFLKPDLIIILGDRYEILSASISAMIQKIPIAHIHGGEITKGAIDDKIRHSISKMSEFHFVSHESYKKRLIQLGENPESVFLVGSLGVEARNSIDFINKKNLEKSMGFKFGKKNLIFTYHPETLNIDNIKLELDNILNAISIFDNINFIVTLPNADEGNELIFKKLSKLALKKSNVFVFQSLGQLKYFSCLKLVDGVIGNSSSGIIEVPSFKKGTINIGERQEGRIKSSSIIDCKPIKSDVINSINLLYTKKFQSSLKQTVNPYGSVNTSEKIFKIISNLSFPLKIKKAFYDLDFKVN